MTDAIPEGCTPADAMMLRRANHALALENAKMRSALQFIRDFYQTNFDVMPIAFQSVGSIAAEAIGE